MVPAATGFALRGLLPQQGQLVIEHGGQFLFLCDEGEGLEKENLTHDEMVDLSRK